MALSDYLQQTADILRDTSFLFTTKAQMTRYVNEARTELARQTGCVMRLISGQSAFGSGAQPGSFIPGAGQPGALPGAFTNTLTSTATNSFQTIPGSERMPFYGFGNTYLAAQHQGCERIIDVASLSISWGGSARPTLDWMPWEDLQSYARASNVLATSFPAAWSVLNPGDNGEVWVWPVPSQALEMEWLVYAVPTYLYSDDDYDAVPSSRRNSIKFGAAMLAMLAKEKYASAQYYGGLFANSMGVSTVANDRGKIPSAYFTAFS